MKKTPLLSLTLLLCLTALPTPSATAQPPAAKPPTVKTPVNKVKKKTMKLQDVYLLVVTDKMNECRDFYRRHFNFTVGFETTIYLQMSAPSESGTPLSLAFMPPDHPFGVIGTETCNGKGLMLSIKVADAKAVYEKLKAEGAPIIHPLTDEAYGQRRFDTRDPAGVTIDTVQDIEVSPGYYDPYQVKPTT